MEYCWKIKRVLTIPFIAAYDLAHQIMCFDFTVSESFAVEKH